MKHLRDVVAPRVGEAPSNKINGVDKNHTPNHPTQSRRVAARVSSLSTHPVTNAQA